MEAKLCFIGHGLMGNCSGLIVDVRPDFNSATEKLTKAQ
jgi:hypothetical protein